MKKISCLLGVAALFTVSTEVVAKDWMSLCNSVGKYAESIMASRQAGMPLHKALEVANSDPLPGHDVMNVVLDAYRHPKFSVEINRQAMITEFGNQIHLGCITAAIDAGELPQ